MITNAAITIFLCGDVMTGRGIDQVLPHPSDPRIYEPYMKDARGYVDIAERASGPIRKPLAYDAVWGDALPEMERRAPDVRLINLETAITASGEYWPGKGINYRMHPENMPVLTAARIDIASLANNHVLDWGYGGLEETIASLRKASIRYTGAGESLSEATAPAIMDLGEKGRVLVFSCGTESSGIPSAWAAGENQPGVNLLPDLSDKTVDGIGEQVSAAKRSGDIVILSIHWGPNWGYDIRVAEERFARSLIDKAGVDIVHGHSSHHVKRIEVCQGKLILYGCGDFLNDYEGIGGREAFRGGLGLMYFARIDPSSGNLSGLDMTPTRIRQFRVNRASKTDREWLVEVLKREGKTTGASIEADDDGRLFLQWTDVIIPT